MNYVETLKLVEYPDQCLTIDFETYFTAEYSLKKMSTIEYIQNRMFKFLGCGFQLFNTPVGDYIPEFTTPNDLDVKFAKLQSMFGLDFDAVTVIVQNAKFDITILKEKFGIVPRYVIDIIDLARHYDARMPHSLKDLATMFKLRPKEEIMQFKGLCYETMTSEQQTALAKYTKNDVDLETNLFKILLPKLSNAEFELCLMRHTLNLYLYPKIRFDLTKANLLKKQMQKKVDEAIQCTNLSKTTISGNKSFVKELQKTLPEGEQVPMKQGKNGLIPALAQQDDGMKALLVHPKEEVRLLCQARQKVKSWPLHIKRINNMTNQAIVENGYLRVPLHYYGGHTGRWSGAMKINLQNLGGRGRTGSGIDPLISEMRTLLCAPKDQTFCIVDSAQIEARLLAWLAGQNDLVEGFRNGEDIYSTFATRLFKVPVREPIETDPEPIVKLLKIRRRIGKDSILGCGYGLGVDKFYQRCLQNDNLRPYFNNGTYTKKFIHELIQTYRSTYKMIPAFWRTVEKCFRWVVKYPHEILYYPHKEGALQDRHLLTFWNQNGTVNLQLPSGRILFYRHARIDKKDSIQYHWGHLWGGSITENIIQSIARDLLGYWILEFEKNKLPVVLHSHDEVVSLSSELEKAIDIMSSSPDWVEDLPLDAEGVISDVYKKE